MTKINNNISFTSNIIITSFPKFKTINEIKFGMPGFIMPCLPDKKTPIQMFEKMVNKQTRTCTSVNLIFKPDESKNVLTAPIHLFHDTSIHKLVPFLKRMLDKTPNIQSIIMWGYKNIDNYPGEKIFDKTLKILSKEKEVTYFKGHNVPLNIESNAFYTNAGDTMYLAPKSWKDENLTPLNENDLKNFYQEYHIAKNDQLSFDTTI